MPLPGGLSKSSEQAYIEFESIEAIVKTASRTKFFIEFYSTCLEGEDHVGECARTCVCACARSGVVTRGLVGVLRDSVGFLGCLVCSWRAWRGFLGSWGASLGPGGA